MSFKLAVLSALLAAFVSADSVNFVNTSGQDIPWVLVGQGNPNVAGPGVLGSGGTVNLPIGPDGDGYSLKMGAPGDNMLAQANSIFQMEWVSRSGTVSYDMSCNNCLPNGPTGGGPNDDPLINFTRSVSPAQQGNGGRCIPFSIGPNDDYDVNNVYPPDQTQPPQSALGTCNEINDVIITFSVSN